MRGVVRAGIVAVLALAGIAVPAENTFAGTGEPADGGEFSRELEKAPTEQPGDDEGVDEGVDEPVKISCTWTATPASEDAVTVLNMFFEILTMIPLIGGDRFDIEYYSIDQTLQRWGEARGRFERREQANCAGATMLTPEEIDGYRWRVVDPPQAAILIPGLRLVVSGRIDLPVPAISPPTEAPVNLGLWLAVTDEGTIIVEGALGPLWARATAEHTSTTFDPGNGSDPIECSGVGTPIVDPDIVEEGPCGYTYRSLADVTNDDLRITVTTTWTVTWETSDGSSDGEPPLVISRSVSTPYNVYEIQTVGTG